MTELRAMDNQFDDPVWQCLASMAIIKPGHDDIRRMHKAAAQITDWNDFAERAETHGIAPLASQHIRQHEIDVDKNARRSLNALVLRHRDADDILNTALIDVLQVGQSRNLEAVVLKGSALAHMIYPQSGLRPRRDIDVLAAPDQAMRLQEALGSSGYDAPRKHAVRAMRFHHHLPPASKTIANMNVSVEIHRDALSGDYPQRLTLASCVDRPQSFIIKDSAAFAFGHRDMLNHLCCHALEPGEPMRLMAMADIVGYAMHFNQQIDWSALRRTHPHVFSSLQHLHYVRPMPDELAVLRPDPSIAPPEGVGQNLLTLKQIMQQQIPNKEKITQLMFPAQWWMRAYYGVAPGAPLGRIRWLRHLPRVLRWAGRRVIAQTAG